MNSLEISTDISSHLHYMRLGSGPAMMLLHGFPENGTLWQSIGERLAKDFTVIIPDIPGAGQSSLDAETVSLEEIADSLKGILDKEQISSILLVGHSMGGYITMAFAEKYPSMVAGISLVHSSAGADGEEKKETRRKSISLIRKGGKKPFVQQMVPALFSEGFKQHNHGVIERQIERGLMLKDESMVAFYTAMMNRPDRIANLKGTDMPVQWIIGKEDSVVAPSAVMQQCSLANVNFVSIYPGCAHMSMLEQPDKLYSDLKEFGIFCYKE